MIVRNQRPKIVILGAGFAGLFAARTLAGKPVEVLLIDQNNYHTFTPLLYQVATCVLDPSEIAYPVRSIFRGKPNVHSLLGSIREINTEEKYVSIKTLGGVRREEYDYLILATGSEPTYFGNKTFSAYAFELRTLSDSVVLRNHLLKKFEQATWVDDPLEREALTSIVVIGGGPTGIETAGAICELYNRVLDRKYMDGELKLRVILVE